MRFLTIAVLCLFPCLALASQPCPATSQAIGACNPVTTTPTVTQVSVPALTSTLLIAANATRRGLTLSNGLTGAGQCTHHEGAAANANDEPIGILRSWSETDPPPNTAEYAYCLSATTITVIEDN